MQIRSRCLYDEIQILQTVPKIVTEISTVNIL